jgi:hypothetical protein
MVGHSWETREQFPNSWHRLSSFPPHPDWPWSPPSLFSSEQWSSLPECKATVMWNWQLNKEDRWSKEFKHIPGKCSTQDIHIYYEAINVYSSTTKIISNKWTSWLTHKKLQECVWKIRVICTYRKSKPFCSCFVFFLCHCA